MADYISQSANTMCHNAPMVVSDKSRFRFSSLEISLCYITVRKKLLVQGCTTSTVINSSDAEDRNIPGELSQHHGC